MPTSFCPHLGLAGDRSLLRTQAANDHRCYAQLPLQTPTTERQQTFCLTAAYQTCPWYRPEPPPTPMLPPPTPPAAWGKLQQIYLVVLGVAILAVAILYGRAFLLPTSPTPTPISSPTLPVALSSSTLAALPATPAPAPARYVTPTPEDEGRVLVATPRSDGVAWWTSAETRGQVGDSFLYAGFFAGQGFVSAIRFDLDRIPPGAPLRYAALVLTGRQSDRLDAGAAGAWTVQWLSATTLPALSRADFQQVLNAPATAALLPVLTARDLGVGRQNVWEFDPASLLALQTQIREGEASLLLRLSGPLNGERALFSWDAGVGPATAGNGPLLVIALGPAPLTPLPTASPQVIIATLTPTPANVLTVAANVLTATANSRSGDSPPTTIPLLVVTPTPLAANLATIQANAVLLGEAPVVEHTPTPANPATATADSLYATAIAITTGTFTPTPPGAVTPIYLTATATPANLATAVAWVLTATAQSEQGITPTPRPYNVLVPSPTWTPFVITATPRTAAQASLATAVALTTGTFTPLPPNATVVGGALAATPTPAAFLPGTRVVVVSSQAVNLRSGPGANFTTITTTPPGALLEIISGPQPTDVYSWWQVRYTDSFGIIREGWMADRFLSPASRN